jgi:CopG family nickel-responsive transcriptional regulator
VVKPKDKDREEDGVSMARFGVSMDAQLLRRFDELIAKMGYDNRSEAIRDLVRDRLVETSWEEQTNQVAGVVALVYDHDMRLLGDHMTDMQHDHGNLVTSSMHVHLDEHNCLEVIVMRGTGQQLRQLGQRLLSLRGVKHGRLLMTGSGD